MRVRLLFHAALTSSGRTGSAVLAATVTAAVGALTPVAIAATAAAQSPPPAVPVPGTDVNAVAAGAAQAAQSTQSAGAPRVDLSAPSSVTRGAGVTLTARLTLGGAALPARPVAFVARAPGAATWQSLGTARTAADGTATLAVRRVAAVTEFGAYDDGPEAHSAAPAATTVVHVIDISVSAPRAVAAGAVVHITGRLLRDGSHGISGQRVQVRFRAGPGSRWSGTRWARTDGSGTALLPAALTRSVQVGVRFPGGSGLAASPLAVVTVVVRRGATATGGFVFPFLRPSSAQSPGSWSLDQGVDLAAAGYACGSAAKLVAVGDGTVIQTGISGFGPTAPVLRMSSGPFRGRNVYYGHTGRIYVHVGQHVRAGQVIAEIGCGRVGASAAPHLEIGVGEPGGPPCCPPMHATADQMLRQLLAAYRRA